MKLIVDAGPLIALSRVGCLNLLPKLFDEVMVPSAVMGEVAGPGETRPGSEVAQCTWAHVCGVALDKREKLQRIHDIDPGEAEAILLAQKNSKDSVLLIDEQSGFQCAQSLGLHTIRTGALLVAAAERGLVGVGTVRQTIGQLRETGYIDQRAEREILSLLHTK